MTFVAVRELCEFTAKRGDLDLRFTPAPSAQEGIAGHAAVTAKRGAGYQREVVLETSFESLTIRGRADGLRPKPLLLEEIKTFRGDLGRMPDNHRALHWAQLKTYGAQLCEREGHAAIELGLVYYDVDKQRETSLRETCTAADLAQFYAGQCETYLRWDLQQQAHKATRDAALKAVAFPHPEFHAGQRTFAEAIYRAAGRGHDLMVQAPTGIGKSIGTLFPALKAMASQYVDKIFFLTAKTSGRRMALDALSSLTLGEGVLPLRVLELVARDKACVYPDKACHGASCPRAAGFYDRLPMARQAAIVIDRLDQAAVRTVAAEHTICPYYLSQDLVRWSDVVVGDYNYYFDQSALLHGLTVLNGWKVAVLVDEAHNLIERARAMYSASMDQAQLRSLRKIAPKPVKRGLTQLQTVWDRFSREQAPTYAAYADPPQTVIDALQRVVVVAGEYFNENPAAVAPELQRFYFDALNFLGLAEQFGEHSLFDVQPMPGSVSSSKLSIRNIVPARFLAPRFSTSTTTIAFSATLNPPHYYRDLLGFPEQTPWLDVPSPFDGGQLQILIKNISTRYQDRSASVAPIAEIIAKQFRAQPGNYLVFASSYDYLNQLSAELRESYPDVPLFLQAARMTELDRSQFIEGFDEDSQRVGLAVLGGAFAEGIDLPGRRLIGAFIATLGLPQVNPINEATLERMEKLYGARSAYDYTYRYPGIQKVVQAAGRVIRTAGDQGVVYLIDDRFGHVAVKKLLPAWWFAHEGGARWTAAVEPVALARRVL